MNKKEEELLSKIRPERHISAMTTLRNIRYIKSECKDINCNKCIFYNENASYYEEPPCIITGYEGLNPEDWDEYKITERMYK